MVIGSSSTGGDTYLASSIIAKELSKQISSSIKVDAVGAISAFNILKRSDDGHTIMVFHDQSYLGHIYGHKGYFNIFNDLIVGPTFASNPGNAYLVPKNSAYKNFDDILKAVEQDKKIKVAIQAGGTSEIGFSAMKYAIKMIHPGKESNFMSLNTGSQSDLNQQLFDGQADIIYGSVQANEAYTHLPKDDKKAMRFLWLTANHATMLKTRKEGFGQTNRDSLMSYVTPNIRVPLTKENDFTFDKEFFFLFNKNTDPKIIEYYNQAISEVFKKEQIQSLLSKSFFSPNYRPALTAHKYLQEKSHRISHILDSIKTTDHQAELHQGPLSVTIDYKTSHLFFPKIIITLMGLTFIAIVISHIRDLPKKCSSLFSLDLTNKGSVFISLFLIILYFFSMNFVGMSFPNKGYGFLFCSIPFMFCLSLVYNYQIHKKAIIALTANALITPCLAWYILGQLFGISLP